MQISACPKCYKEGKLSEGKHINNGTVNGKHRAVYFCKECKDSYVEELCTIR